MRDTFLNSTTATQEQSGDRLGPLPDQDQTDRSNWKREAVSGRPGQAGRIAVCIIDENATVPPDRRVWQEARALTDAGYRVSVICPKRPGYTSSHEIVEGIEIYRYHDWEAATKLGYLIEYPWALVCQFLLGLRVFARTRFRLLHACNPPDTIFIIGAVFKLFGVRFIFDHHDLSPELIETKFGSQGFAYRAACLLERLTFRTASVSIATNESYREVALSRGGMLPSQVFVVRGALDLKKIRLREPKPELKEGKRRLVVYVGIMSTQDGIDLLLESIASMEDYHRHNTAFVLIGSGTDVPRLKLLTSQKGLDGVVKFTGYIPDEELELYLSTADVAVAPDPFSPLNDKSTMNKIMHYMAYGLPIVQFDLTEGRRSAGAAALYASRNDPKDFAAKITTLLESDTLRRELGNCGRKQVEQRLNWQREQASLLEAYAAALN
jgi:glycosyltransferase involved in cell wall biosynthesis